ncbi:hypothetical protein LI142_13745 [Eubacterium limosum]|uniref:hypothetical protein n=1 Tax=Eubacterium limosum TaxID=1736 RepID=UPI001D0945C0|nr:hypothetical protein [Eubacterium limosum]MCB6570562.1 hypothetical protein [Eubacterium limosum]
MKKLIIVCEEKCRVYGDYLSQLISLDDDTVDSSVGTKDGTVAAQVWLEKDYIANSAHISSDQYILFIGNDKLMKEKSTHMKVVFSQFGMTYGWLGKQAVLCVEKVVQTSEYESFISFARSYQSDINVLIGKKTTQKALPEKALIPAKAALAVIQPAAGVALAVKQLTLNTKIKKQQYSCEVMKFYLESLSDFLGL